VRHFRETCVDHTDKRSSAKDLDRTIAGECLSLRACPSLAGRGRAGLCRFSVAPLRWKAPVNVGGAAKNFLVWEAAMGMIIYLASPGGSKQYSNTPILFPSCLRLCNGAVSNPVIGLLAGSFLLASFASPLRARYVPRIRMWFY
jgi:hypothetical protein